MNMNNFSTSLLGTLTAIILSAITLFSYNNPKSFFEALAFIGITLIITTFFGVIFALILLIIKIIDYIYTYSRYAYNFITSFWMAIKDLLCLEVDCDGNVRINKNRFNEKFKTES